MKRVLINGSIFALVFLSILYTIGNIVNKGLRRSKMQYFVSWNEIYDSKINADVLICGESRAKLTYSPKILDSILGINSYNLALNGAMLPLQLARLQIYLQHNKKPKYIIQNVDFFTFNTSGEGHLIDAEQFLPYLNDTLLTKVTNGLKEKFTIPEMYFPLFRYNNHINLIKEGILCYFNIGKRGTNHIYKGFSSESRNFRDFFQTNIQQDSDGIKNAILPDFLNQFKAYLDYCKANNIKLIFVYGPVFHEAAYLMQEKSSNITRTLESLAHDYNIPFLMYINDSIGYEKDLFIDDVHTSPKGAQEFSVKLANDLKNIIKITQ